MANAKPSTAKTDPAEDFEDAQIAQNQVDGSGTTGDEVQSEVEREAAAAKAEAQKAEALRLEAEHKAQELQDQLDAANALLEAQARYQPQPRERRYARSRGAVVKSFDKKGEATVHNPRAEA